MERGNRQIKLERMLRVLRENKDGALSPDQIKSATAVLRLMLAPDPDQTVPYEQAVYLLGRTRRVRAACELMKEFGPSTKETVIHGPLEDAVLVYPGRITIDGDLRGKESVVVSPCEVHVNGSVEHGKVLSPSLSVTGKNNAEHIFLEHKEEERNVTVLDMTGPGD